MKTKFHRGFTLVELLIVMVIIGILATIGISSFGTARIKARDAKRKADLQAIAKALEAYANDYRRYPLSSLGAISCSPPATCDWDGPFTDDKGTLYLATIPSDTSDGRNYVYESDGTYFRLFAALENDQDPSYDSSLSTSCGTVDCNYQTKSSNTN